MKNPTHEAGFSKEDLKKYAQYRKEREFLRINKLNGIEDSEERENSDENREPLSFDIEKVVKIQLSWGGDGDGYKLTFDKENNLISGVYYWEDWGVYEEINLSDEEVDEVYSLYLYSDVTSFL